MKLRKTTLGGFLLTFPKPLARSLGWDDGDLVDFVVRDKDTVELKRKRPIKSDWKHPDLTGPELIHKLRKELDNANTSP